MFSINFSASFLQLVYTRTKYAHNMPLGLVYCTFDECLRPQLIEGAFDVF